VFCNSIKNVWVERSVFNIIRWALIGRRILYSIVPSVNKKGNNYDGIVVRELAQFKTSSI